MGWAPQTAMPAVRTPAITNGGRAARSSKSAYQSAAAPATKIKGVNQAARMAKLRDRVVIQALKKLPREESASTAIGIRTNISNAALSDFLSTNAPAWLIPLATNGSYSRDAACASKAKLRVEVNPSVISIATDAHHKPAITANMTDRVRSHAAEPAAPRSAGISKPSRRLARAAPFCFRPRE